MGYPVSPRFAAALTASHVVRVRVDVCAQDGTVVLGDVPVLDGSVTVTKGQTVRRALSVSLRDVAGELLPSLPTDPLAPYGNELRAYRGIDFGDGTLELVPLGVFRLTDFESVDSPAGMTVTVKGSDRMVAVGWDKLTDDYPIPAGTLTTGAWQTLLAPALPASQQWSVAASPLTTPALAYKLGDDRATHAAELAASLGMTGYFDATGTAVLSPVPVLTSTASTATFTEGVGATMLSLTRDLTRAPSSTGQAYNHVIVTGEGSGAAAPVRGEAYDNDPGSPTYAAGPYGHVVEVLTSTLVTTADQATAQAQASLRDALGITESLPFTAFAYPHLDVDDVVTVIRGRSKVNAVVAVNGLTIPLRPDTPMQVTTRARRGLTS